MPKGSNKYDCELSNIALKWLAWNLCLSNLYIVQSLCTGFTYEGHAEVV